MARYLVFKGSVAVEGISLTVAGLTDEYFEIAIIPKTWDVTNLSHLKSGTEVNLEADIIAKYVERILTVGAGAKAEGSSQVTFERLAELGYE
jgi:riboflavin synthase